MEDWMNAPITFPPISSDDVSKDRIIVEDEVEGYLIRRVYVVQGASVEVMFEHCFENLPATVNARLKETHMDLVGFAGDVVKPMGKIDLEICFGIEGLCRRTIMKFRVIRAPLPYNIILGRSGIKILWAISSSLHCMMKLPTSRGIATLMTRSVIISECRRLEKKQMIEEELKEKVPKGNEVALTEEVVLNLVYPDQRVIIGRGLTEECKSQLKLLLKDNLEVFAWKPSDMTGVPRGNNGAHFGCRPHHETSVLEAQDLVRREKSGSNKGSV
ncbi:hypothetical protein Tco_0650295 [Tanacetum coccineum]